MAAKAKNLDSVLALQDCNYSFGILNALFIALFMRFYGCSC